MPNICTGFMNVRGYSSNVDEFIAILQAKYSYCKDSANGDYSYCVDPKNFTHIPHFFRVFSAVPFDEVQHSGVYKCVSIEFEVAWSVHSCMFPGSITYYNDYELDHKGEHFASTILIESKRLQLEIEIWSYEPGIAFQEHYKICSGVLVKDECFDFSIACLEGYSNYEEFINDGVNKDIPIDKDTFNKCIEDEYYIYEYDLHDEITDFTPEDEPKYLANLVMVKQRKDD